MNLQERFLSAQELLDRMPEYIDLFKMGFTAKIDEEIMHKRYYEDPFGDFIMCVYVDADNNDKLVGFAAALPTPSYINGKEIKAAIAVNGVTHPDYKGLDIFPKIMRGLNRELKRQGFCFVYAFPHYTSNRLFHTKFEWKDVSAIPTFLKVISDDSDFSGFESDKIKVISAEETKWKPTAEVCIGKSPEYLKWRYDEKDYTFIGDGEGNFIIFKPFNDELNMVEYYGADSESKKMLVGWLLNYAKQNGYKKVSTFVKLNTEDHAMLERFDFRLSAPIRFFAIKELNENGEIDLLNFSKWNISMGDHNAY